jgi:hypothetical protein
MRAFVSWCKRNNISFKRRRSEADAFAVWKLLQLELEAKNAEIASLLDEMNVVGNLLVDIKQEMVERGLAEPEPANLTNQSTKAG